MSACIDYIVSQKMQDAKGTPCSNLHIPKNGFHNGTSEETFRLGTILVFGCNVGYHLVGDDTLTCSVYGQWSGSMPQCEEISCKKPPPFANGFWSPLNDKYSFGRTVTAFCDDTFNMDGADIWTCSEDHWISSGSTDTFPICLKQNGLHDWGEYVYPGVIAVLLFLLLLTNALSQRQKLRRWCCCLKRSKDTKKERPEKLLDIFVEEDEAYGSKCSNTSQQTSQSSIVNENPDPKLYSNEQRNIVRDREQTRPNIPEGITVVNNITVQSGNTTCNSPQMNGKRNAADVDKTSRNRKSQTESTSRKGIEEKRSIEESCTSVLKHPSESDRPLPEADEQSNCIEPLLPREAQTRLLPEPDEQSNCKVGCIEPLFPRDAQNPATDGQCVSYKIAVNSSEIHCDDINERK